MATITKADIVGELMKTEKWKSYKQSTLMGKNKDVLLKLLEETKGNVTISISENIETAPAKAEPKKRSSKKLTAEDKSEAIASLAKVDFSSGSNREMVGEPKTLKSGTITMTYIMWKNPFYIARPEMPEAPKTRTKKAK
jgi:hypothetical protein